jgi:hypothetical protein
MNSAITLMTSQNTPNHVATLKALPSSAALSFANVAQHTSGGIENPKYTEYIGDMPVQFVGEVQLCLQYFLDVRKEAHLWFKINRAKSLEALKSDCEQYYSTEVLLEGETAPADQTEDVAPEATTAARATVLRRTNVPTYTSEAALQLSNVQGLVGFERTRFCARECCWESR